MHLSRTYYGFSLFNLIVLKHLAANFFINSAFMFYICQSLPFCIYICEGNLVYSFLFFLFSLFLKENLRCRRFSDSDSLADDTFLSLVFARHHSVFIHLSACLFIPMPLSHSLFSPSACKQHFNILNVHLFDWDLWKCMLLSCGMYY